MKRVGLFRVCLWFSTTGFGISDERSIWHAGITQPFCLVLVNDGENLLHYPFCLFLFLFLLFFIQSMLFCCRQVSTLKRAKLHVLARMSAANLVILFTHFFLPVDISLHGNSPGFVFQVCPCLCGAIARRPQSSFHSALRKELYKGCKYLARYEGKNTKLQLCAAEFWAILNSYRGAANDSSTAEVLLVSNNYIFFTSPAIIDKTLLKQWSSYTKRPSVRVWQTHTRSETAELDPKILSGCRAGPKCRPWQQMGMLTKLICGSRNEYTGLELCY